MDIVNSSMKGINGTVFMYGQTGSGKTHTMLGGYSTEISIEEANQEMQTKSNRASFAVGTISKGISGIAISSTAIGHNAQNPKRSSSFYSGSGSKKNLKQSNTMVKK
jgi:hypothetical protein